ncbi:MAG: phosphoribosylglycinamide formyltransferase [Prosthecochloris sp.]|uniref:phosphoribosylglycinamide formyltransferase n=1 Tax=unclassified Prosthecochloris TaxID=2632826 RepID=UPI000DF829C5|nr:MULTISPECIES: phosphoribosylglycinamide formyltransferase [unclassified Prosthecochloris]MCW8798133.1 phosphoribosylglycinamide formyltransferase [Prosthecochloris sp.]RDD29738.1 phosphoribosylglycinamide formyltransferase [Prosthecochloris sp. ZM]
MANHKTKLAVFCSGSGTNFQAIFHAINERNLPAEVALCVSNRSECGAMSFASQHGIATLHISEKQYETPEKFGAEMLKALEQNGIEYILLAGYLRKVPSSVVEAYSYKMLNIHPALLPKFGGPGMYGINVHKAVLASGEKETGATVHYVDAEYDKGPILLQGRVPVKSGDTPESLAARVLECEHRLYPDALEKLLIGSGQ